jgi:tryptophan-rich sensory protein
MSIEITTENFSVGKTPLGKIARNFFIGLIFIKNSSEQRFFLYSGFAPSWHVPHLSKITFTPVLWVKIFALAAKSSVVVFTALSAPYLRQAAAIYPVSNLPSFDGRTDRLDNTSSLQSQYC